MVSSLAACIAFVSHRSPLVTGILQVESIPSLVHAAAAKLSTLTIAISQNMSFPSSSPDSAFDALRSHLSHWRNQIESRIMLLRTTSNTIGELHIGSSPYLTNSGEGVTQVVSQEWWTSLPHHIWTTECCKVHNASVKFVREGG